MAQTKRSVKEESKRVGKLNSAIFEYFREYTAWFTGGDFQSR